MADFMFVKIEGVDGSSDSDGHKKWIPVQGYSSGVDLPVDGATGAARANPAPFTFSKLVDRSSPKLYQMCCEGAPISKITVHHCRQVKGKNVPYFVYEMKDSIIGGVSTSASGDELPTEEISISYSKMEWELKPTDVKGAQGAAIKSKFDFVKNIA